MGTIIPESSLNFLPFSEQAYSQWEGRTDLDVLYFLLELFDKTDNIILPDGTTSSMNYKMYATEVFARCTHDIVLEAQAFAEAATLYQPAPGSVVKQVEVPKCLDDIRFGRAAKYLIAWEGVVGEVLSESAFFSLAHLLEADNDLKCSVRLASSLYYKQALQVLRSYIENIILPLYFCANPTAYRQWKRNRFRTPSFRRSDGVLSTLVNEFIINSDLADEASNLYGDLNEAVHGSESSMIHSGTVQGHWKGHIFDDRKFGQWCDYLSRAIDLGISSRYAAEHFALTDFAFVGGKIPSWTNNFSISTPTI